MVPWPPTGPDGQFCRRRRECPDSTGTGCRRQPGNSPARFGSNSGNIRPASRIAARQGKVRSGRNRRGDASGRNSTINGRRLLSLLKLPLRGDADQLDLAFHADLVKDVHLMPPDGLHGDLSCRAISLMLLPSIKASRTSVSVGVSWLSGRRNKPRCLRGGAARPRR